MFSKLLLFAFVFLFVIVNQSWGQMPPMGPMGPSMPSAQMPPNTLTNATNVLQELMNQANQMMQQSSQMGGSGGSGNNSNPFFDFFRRIIMLMFDMVNNFIRLFSGGLLSLNNQLKPGNMLTNRVDVKDNEINDTDMKELHAKAHGPNCLCNAFSRANLPGLAKEKTSEEQNELLKRSANEDEEVTADKVIDFFDARKVEQLLQQFARSEHKKNAHK